MLRTMGSMDPKTLNVITVISNQLRFESRLRLFRENVEWWANKGVSHYIVEARHGQHAWEVHKSDGSLAQHIRLSFTDEVWQKEAMINAAVRFIPHADHQHLMWADGDIAFARPDIASEIQHALQCHPVVQPFSHCADLDQNYRPTQQHHGFAYRFREFNQKPDQRYGVPHMHPGYCWAWRRDAWDRMGGMVDRAILGSADHIMACGLIGHVEEGVTYPTGLHPNYGKMITSWADRAKEVIDGDIGYVSGIINHFFHGKKEDRGYRSRPEILARHQYDPENDVIMDGQGLLRLRGNKPGLRYDCQQYFRSRNEDSR